MSAIEEIITVGQHLWLDDISTVMLSDGTIERYRDECAMTGITANPTIFEKAIAAGAYDESVKAADGDAEDIFWSLAVDDIGRAADLLVDAHRVTGRRSGYVSIELSPRLADDAEGSVRQGVELFDRIARPNVMVKVPGTPAGEHAIEELTFLGVNVNVTLLFGRAQWERAHQAFQRGLQRRLAEGLDLSPHSVASFFLSRIDRAVDDDAPADLRHMAALDSATTVHAAWVAALESDPWPELLGEGASPQELLWASTSPKAEELTETYYVERLVAPDSVVTLPSPTLDALCALERVDQPRLDERSAEDAQRRLDEIGRTVRPIDEVAEQLQVDGVQAFLESFDSLLATIEDVRS